jgi:hypothetical protein
MTRSTHISGDLEVIAAGEGAQAGEDDPATQLRIRHLGQR